MKRIADRFRVVGQLGEGGIGAVLEVEHEHLAGRRYAAKILKPEYREHPVAVARMFREARAAARLDHPGIVGVQDVIDDPLLGPVLLMERLHGESLHQVAQRRFLEPAQLRVVALQVLDALAAAHVEGLVHRDIKPSNLMVEATSSGERLRLLDFGLVTEPSSDLTSPGAFMGTMRFASPEQALGQPVSAATDLYALAQTLVYVATGQTVSLRAALEGADPEGRLAELGFEGAWVRVLGRALRADPADRYASAADFAAALRALPGGAPAPLLPRDVRAAPITETFTMTFVRRAGPVGPPPTVPASPLLVPEPEVRVAPLEPARRRWPLVLAAVVVAGATAIVAVVAGPGRPPPGQVACRALGAEIAARQRPDGGFAGIEQMAPGGWDTAQQLAALRAAADGCGLDVPQVSQRAARALGSYHLPGGWGSAGAEAPHAVATAWAVLAGPEAAPAALADLRAYQRADGAFRTVLDRSTPSPYATVMGAWALHAVSDPGAEAALDWLQAAASDPHDALGVRLTPGLDEQLGWVLHQAGRPAPPGLAARILERAEQDAYPSGRVALEQIAPGELSIVTQGLPWAVLAAEALGGDSTLDPDQREALADFATEQRRRWDREAAALRTAPGYVLAENLLAAVPP